MQVVNNTRLAVVGEVFTVCVRLMINQFCERLWSVREIRFLALLVEAEDSRLKEPLLHRNFHCYVKCSQCFMTKAHQHPCSMRDS